MSKISGTKSTLDHFIVSDNLFGSINKCTVLHEGDNLSDHSLVSMSLSMPVVHFEEPSIGCKQTLKWDIANDIQINDYKCTLDCLLGQVQIPWDAIKCQNVHCAEHNALIDVSQ